MSEQSKEIDLEVANKATEGYVEAAENGDDSGDDADPIGSNQNDTSNNLSSKKKKSKRSKLKKALGAGSKDGEAGPSKDSSNPASKLTSEMVEQLLEMNPSLKGEVSGMSKEKATETLKKLDVADLLTGMSVSGKNQKDMASYKFWQTQPVPRFDEAPQAVEGPIKLINPEQVSKEPRDLLGGFVWVTMDLTNDEELKEVYELLTGHYVEDSDATFRLNYSASFLNWALKSPGWRKEWHVGVRVGASKKLVAFISGVPVSLRVRAKVIKSTEINFLCVHKKLRDKRLTPILIEEITRRNYALGIFQAIYTAGIVLPKPVSSCRYYHRPLDWMKLYEVGFSNLPAKSTTQRQITKNHLPSNTSLKGLRPMQRSDVDAVLKLLERYLENFDLAPKFDAAEIDHWLLHDEEASPEQVIWAYVVEDPTSHKITDFFSFYCLDSLVVKQQKHEKVHAAYLFYYATEHKFRNNDKILGERLNALINDALIIAKRFSFDVFNALTLLDNPLFLTNQKFGPGDGQLHFYLYNYRTAPIAGGVDQKNNVDENRRGGVGVVML